MDSIKPEQHKDYQELLEKEERLGYLIKENQILNARIERLELFADEFGNFKRDLTWVLRISKLITAALVFLAGDEIKRRLGL